jgi:transposase
MFLRASKRLKDGKEHYYWSIVENKRVAGGKVVQRHVLYLGEINDSQREAWRKTIEIFEDGKAHPRTVALFPHERIAPTPEENIVRIRLDRLELRRPRQWGACWMACQLYEQLDLEGFWAQRLPPSRKGTRWDLILQALCAYRLIDPGSEWRFHRQWFEQSAMADLLGSDFSLAESHRIYEVHDRLLEHKQALFSHLQQRWRDLFNAKFEVLLYDLTSTYFESDPPFPEGDKRKFGYSRDKRQDCVQVVIALIVTPEGFPLAYELLAGNTSDKTTLRAFLKKIEAQYGKAERIWVMDRGIPTEEVLAEMRASDPPVSYIVGTPKGRLSKLEAELCERPWEQVREGVEMKLLPREGELYVFAKSRDRVHKERAIRRRRLKELLARLRELSGMKLKRDALLIKIGQAKARAGRTFSLVDIRLPKAHQPVNSQTFTFTLNKSKLREVCRREGRYLLRSFMTSPCENEKLWEFYMQLTRIEDAFKNLKGDLAIRPIHHQREDRIEAHIFIAFLSYCLQVTLQRRLRDLAPGLTVRSVLEKFAAVSMVDVHLPTTDGRTVIMARYTQPENELKLLLKRLKIELPAQPPPRITANGKLVESDAVVQTF